METSTLPSKPSWASEALIKDLMNPEILQDYPTLAEFLSARTVTAQESELLELRQTIADGLVAVVKEMAARKYHIMELSNDYGECGEQRVSISYCRKLLNIPHNRPVTQFDADIFRRKVEDERQQLGLKGKDLEALKSEYKDLRPAILGVKYRLIDHVADSANEILRKLGSKKRMAAGFYGNTTSIIIGDAHERREGDFWIYYFENEDARTPNNVLSIAAMIAKKNIWLRLEACRTIFYNKWVKIYRYDQREKQLLLSDPWSNISEAIKLKCAQLYSGNDENSLIAVEDAFVKEMGDIIVQHELGHNVSQLNGKYLDYYAIGEGVRRYGENILTHLKEFLADWVIQTEMWVQKGPIKTCIDLATDEKKTTEATRLLLMYISDSWFYDTGENYMFLHSDIMMTILAGYLNPDGSFDFARLKRDIYSETDERSRLASIYGFIENLYFHLCEKIDQMVTQSTYVFNDETIVNFKSVLNEVLVAIKEDRALDGKEVTDTENLDFKNVMWDKIFNAIDQSQNDLKQKIQKFLEKAGEESIKAVFKQVAGEKVAEAFAYDHRKYIVEKMKAAGYWLEPQPLKVTDTLKMVMEDLFFSKNEQKEAAKEFHPILKGSPKTVRLSHSGEPSPFVEVLQEMLRKQKDSPLDQSISMTLKEGDGSSAETLEKKLDELVEQINKKVFDEIRILRVKKSLLPLPQLEELLKSKVCLDGDTLLDKVWHLDEADMEEAKLLEFYLPTKIGYPCMNTVRALKKLNARLNVKDSTKKSEAIIDKKLVGALSKEYMLHSF